MKHQVVMYGTIAGAAALTGAMFAFAQTPPQDNPRVPTDPPVRGKPDPGVRTGNMLTPSYAQPLSGTLGENTVQVFKDKDFLGEQTAVANLAKAHQAGTLNPFADTFDNDGSSLKWNIAPGTLVVLFDDAKGEGVQLALWGKGQIPTLDDVDFENSATRWAWYDVGSGAEPRSAGNTAIPHGSQALATSLSADSIELFEDQQFAGDERQVMASISKQAAGTWNTLPGNKENGLSSLRWNLPEGVIVMFSAEDNGNNNIIIFGEGQNADLGAIGFDNRASRWTWANIGASKPRMPNDDGRDKPRPDAPRQPDSSGTPHTPPAVPPSTPPSNPR